MKNFEQLYIDGHWVNSHGNAQLEVINPADGELYASVPSADVQDVDIAIRAASKAFSSWSEQTADFRAAIINDIADGMQARIDELTEVIVASMGCPLSLAAEIQVQGAIDAFRSFAPLASEMDKQQVHANHIVVTEAVGVCVLINPWNYPLSQLVGKLGPALAAGCTVVVKPAEQTPLQDLILAEIIHQSSLPHGVFNLLTGVGSQIGEALCVGRYGVFYWLNLSGRKSGASSCTNRKKSLPRARWEITLYHRSRSRFSCRRALWCRRRDA
jgi:aldehyde dehydrogenase (NAD+)